MPVDDFPVKGLVHDILQNGHFIVDVALEESLHLFDFDVLVRHLLAHKIHDL